MIEKIALTLTVLQGSGLAAKDRTLTGRKTTSDPFVEVYNGGHYLGRTDTKAKTLDPVWNPGEKNKFFMNVKPSEARGAVITLKIFDEDVLSEKDKMGVVQIPITITQKTTDTTEWYEVPPDSAKNACGKLQVRIQTSLQLSRSLVRGNAFPLSTRKVQVGVAWDMLHGMDIDMDVSCVAITKAGLVSMPDTVYYANLANPNSSVYHSGDEREGDEKGDDELLTFNLDMIPTYVLGFYLTLTVATPNTRLDQIRSAVVRVRDANQGNVVLCTIRPSEFPDATAMYLLRLARADVNNDQEWVVAPILETHPTARDFGGLIPFMKSYTQDLLPSISVDPTERVAILRKGGNVRLADYSSTNSLPDVVRLGLAWDVTDGVNIDLDASALCLDADLALVDEIWYRHLTSNDGSIRHHGDEREGDSVGDDETIEFHLSRVNRNVKYIGIVINSFTGQELDDVSKAFCHLFDPAGPSPKMDMASYALTNSADLNGHTALVVGCLYRTDVNEDDWCLCIISEAAQGRSVKDNVDELQMYLTRYPPKPPTPAEEEEEIVVGNFMPEPVPLEEEEIDLTLPP